jgi:hypothetical protein
MLDREGARPCHSRDSRVQCARTDFFSKGPSTMRVMDARFLTGLMVEFRGSMRGLLKDLCRDFERNYAEAAQARNSAIGKSWDGLSP